MKLGLKSQPFRANNMPLPIVSRETILGTITLPKDDNPQWMEEISRKQKELTAFLHKAAIVGNKPGRNFIEGFLLGAMTTYKMLDRQIEENELKEILS